LTKQNDIVNIPPWGIKNLERIMTRMQQIWTRLSKKRIPSAPISQRVFYKLHLFISSAFVLLGIVTFVIPRLPASVAIADQQPLALRTQTATIAAKLKEPQIIVTGTIQAETESQLAFKAFGRVKSVLVEEGEIVTKGQLLATLTADEQFVQYQMAEQALANARAQYNANSALYTAQISAAESGRNIYTTQKDALEKQYDAVARAGDEQIQLAERQLELAQLYDPAALSAEELAAAQKQEEIAQEAVDVTRQQVEAQKQQVQVQIDTYGASESQAGDGVVVNEKARDAQLQMVQAQVDMADSQKRLASLALNNTKIYAPYSGVVTSVFTQEGQVVPAGQPIVSVANHQYQVVTDIADSQRQSISLGQAVTISLENSDQTWTGQITSIFPKVSPMNTKIPVEVSFDQQPENIVLGQIATVTIAQSSESAFFVPRILVTPSFDGPYITFESGEKQFVELGIERGSLVEIWYDGIEEGVTIIKE
jgi:RND family efflux transporter MFP subunit